MIGSRMRCIDRAVKATCENAVFCVGMLMVLSAMYVSAELIARKLLNLSLVGANEISGYTLAIGTAWAFSYTLLKRSHIRIDAFYSLMPPRVRAAIDIVSIASLTGLSGILVWYGTKTLFFAWSTHVVSITTLAMPQWIPMLAWNLGLVMFFILALYLTVMTLMAFVRGDLAEIQARFGTVSGDEEATPIETGV